MDPINTCPFADEFVVKRREVMQTVPRHTCGDRREPLRCLSLLFLSDSRYQIRSGELQSRLLLLQLLLNYGTKTRTFQTKR